MYGLVCTSEPAIEPVTLTEALDHLRQSSSTFAEQMTASVSIAHESHAIAAAYSLVGTAVDVLNSQVLVLLESGTNGEGGTVDVKLQHSDDGSTYTDVTSGAFTQVTVANDNAIQEKAYTGGKQYLKAVATVAGAACSFGVTVLEGSNAGSDSDYISALITAARQWAEGYQNRAYITQTWQLWLDEFPSEDYIALPLPPLQSTDFAVDYYDTAGTKATMTATDYIVDTYRQPGRVVLAYGESWPSTTLRPANGVCITFKAGYGATAASVPRRIRQAILLRLADLYENREGEIVGKAWTNTLAAERLLDLDRIVPV